MSIAKTRSGHISGLQMEVITVEVDISNGLHSFSIVGLGDRSVAEAKDRISAAIKNTGYVSPKQKNQKVVISLAPADIRKEGTSFDLAMALAYLKASGDIDFEYEDILFLGELTLEGGIRPVHGLLPLLIEAQKHGFTTAFIPQENSDEARLAQNIIIYPASTLKAVLDHLSRTKKIDSVEPQTVLCSAVSVGLASNRDVLHLRDMAFIKGNETAKRALEIAIAGCHNIVLYGPPGTGKTMLAQSAVSIIPPLTYDQAIEVTSIYSLAKLLNKGLITEPPFRSPHHTSSVVSILGGGTIPHPGEITLAHRGILFLDEFPEFEQRVIEGLRQPLEDRVATVARARGSATFPAQSILIASMNPCRCGRGRDNGCTCSLKSIQQYQKKISGPILDRIDIWIHVHKIDYEKLSLMQNESEKSVDIQQRIIAARKIQAGRFEALPEKNMKYFNSEMGAGDIEKYALIALDVKDILTMTAEKMELSGRAFHSVIKVARTIADLDKSTHIQKKHVLEAIQYRQKMY
ncbi:MAG: YifB family Mg chelatase-like AAA ATPase [Patescibacteria group bacterium]